MRSNPSYEANAARPTPVAVRPPSWHRDSAVVGMHWLVVGWLNFGLHCGLHALHWRDSLLYRDAPTSPTRRAACLETLSLSSPLLSQISRPYGVGSSQKSLLA